MMVPCGGLLAEDVDFWQTIFRASKILPEDGDSKSLFAGPDYRDAMNAMVLSGLMPGPAKFSRQWCYHPEDARIRDGRSEYSTQWDILRACDWASIDVEMHLRQQNQNEDWRYSMDMRHPQTRFHGTNFAALLMIARTGGFVPGINGHGYNGKYFQGCFTADSLGQAFERCDAFKIKDDCGRLRACSMPIVLEMDAINVQRYHRHRPDLGVTRGVPGEVISGVWIKKVHFNFKLVSCFSKFFGGAMNVPAGHWQDFTMCGNIRLCGTITRFTCDPWRDGWARSNRGHWYCRKCRARQLAHSPFVLYSGIVNPLHSMD